MRQILLAFLKKLKDFLKNKLHAYNVNLPYIITVIIALIVVIGGINLFIELTDTLTTEKLANYDREITDYVISYRSPALTQYFLAVTHIGDAYGYMVVVGLCAIISRVFFKRWKQVLQVTLVLLLASISNMILKRFIDRARPSIEHLVTVETLSYPSGHAMSAMAFYGFVIYLFYRFKMNRLLKYTIMLLLFLLILSIGISRIYLGVHFPSDIAGGFIAGFIWVVFCILIFDVIEIFRRDPSTTEKI